MVVSKICAALLTLSVSLIAAAADPVVIDPNIAEAVFRYQFAHNESGQQSSADVYCVGYGTNIGSENDPPAEILMRLSGMTPSVEPASHCPCDKGRADHRSWITFRIETVKCKSETSCEVEGGYYESPLSSSGNTYYLEKRDGKWVVTRDVMHWIS